MVLTIGNWIFVGLVALSGLIGGICIWVNKSTPWGFITIITTVILCIALLFLFTWWHTNTAKGIRAMKDYHSNMSNGLMREIIITSEDGREIFYYKGRCDVETSHQNSENYILFESEEGQRYIIYYGMLDTVLIVETEGDY